MTVQGETFPTVWHALYDDPVERLDLRMRSDLMIALRRQVSAWGITQKEAAKRLGISQPRLNQLLKGKINEFSVGALVKLLEPAGLDYEFHVKAA